MSSLTSDAVWKRRSASSEGIVRPVCSSTSANPTSACGTTRLTATSTDRGRTLVSNGGFVLVAASVVSPTRQNIIPVRMTGIASAGTSA